MARRALVATVALRPGSRRRRVRGPRRRPDRRGPTELLVRARRLDDCSHHDGDERELHDHHGRVPGCAATTRRLPPRRPMTPTATVTTSSAATTLVITGHGWGHGMGMSQWGAYGYAEHGWSYEQHPAALLQRDDDRDRAGRDDPGAAARREAPRHARVRRALAGRRRERSRGSRCPPGSSSFRPRSRSRGGSSSHRSPSPASDAPLQVGKRPYRGSLVVISNGKTLQVVNAVDLESYLDGVVGAEMPQDWPRPRSRRRPSPPAPTRSPSSQSAVTGKPVRHVRRHAQPGLRRHRRRGAVGDERGRRDGAPRRSLPGQDRDDLLLVELRAAGRSRPPRRSARRFPTSSRSPTPTTPCRPTTTGARCCSTPGRRGRRSGSPAPLLDLTTVTGPSGQRRHGDRGRAVPAR